MHVSVIFLLITFSWSAFSTSFASSRWQTWIFRILHGQDFLPLEMQTAQAGCLTYSMTKSHTEDMVIKVEVSKVVIEEENIQNKTNSIKQTTLGTCRMEVSFKWSDMSKTRVRLKGQLTGQGSVLAGQKNITGSQAEKLVLKGNKN